MPTKVSLKGLQKTSKHPECFGFRRFRCFGVLGILGLVFGLRFVICAPSSEVSSAATQSESRSRFESFGVLGPQHRLKP